MNMEEGILNLLGHANDTCGVHLLLIQTVLMVGHIMGGKRHQKILWTILLSLGHVVSSFD